jgi:hypothetical protein
MKTMKTLLTSLALLLCVAAVAQTDTTAQKAKPTYKKFLFGVSFHQTWSSIEGTTPELFYKPSLGGGAKVEYYPLQFLGISAGVMLQQRGAGVIQPDTGFTAPSMNTYRTRFRTNYVDFPIAIILRTPPIKGGAYRISGSFGVVPSYMWEAVEVWHSVEDGFHKETDQTANMNRFDLNLQATLGTDINAFGSIFHVGFIGSFGTMNVYNSSGTLSTYNGKNRSYGFRLGWMF